MNDHGPAKKLIYECQLNIGDEYDIDTIIAQLEFSLEKTAEEHKWCPDWVYEINATDEENLFDIKVYGDIEE